MQQQLCQEKKGSRGILQLNFYKPVRVVADCPGDRVANVLALQSCLQGFQPIVNCHRELEQRIRTTYLLLNELRTFPHFM